MGIQSFLSTLGLGDLALNPSFVAEIAVLGLNAFLFFSALAVAIIAFRSAAVAHYAKLDAEAHLRTAKALASEVRSLTAQVEQSASRAIHAPAYVPFADAHHADGGHADATHADHAPSHHDDDDDHHGHHAAEAHGDAHHADASDHDAHGDVAHAEHGADHGDEVHHQGADTNHDGHDAGMDVSPVISARAQHSHAHGVESHNGRHAEEAAQEKSLDAAAKGATVPFALLRRRRWDS